MEFAVIATGGKQYTVSKGDTITIEKLTGAHKEGDSVVFDKVLLVGNGDKISVGQPSIAGASVAVEIVEQVARVFGILVSHDSAWFSVPSS